MRVRLPIIPNDSSESALLDVDLDGRRILRLRHSHRQNAIGELSRDVVRVHCPWQVDGTSERRVARERTLRRELVRVWCLCHSRGGRTWVGQSAFR